MDAPQNIIMDTVEPESGVGSNDSSSGGEMNSGEEASFSSWSSSNSCESGPDFFGDDDLCHSSEGYSSDFGLVPNSVQPSTTLHWVRMSSLRIHDNASLSEAMLNSKTRFRAVFIVDPWFASGERKFGVNRWRFLLECLHDLDKRLKEYNTRLYVAKGHPVAVLERLCTRWNVTELTFQQDREIRSDILEEAVEKLAEQMELNVIKRPGHTLYDTNKLLERAGHRQIATIKDFKEVLHLAEKPDSPVEAPPISNTNFEEELPEEFQIPTLQDLGFAGSECLYNNKGGWIGGETMALKRLEEYCQVRSRPPTDSFVDLLFDKLSLSPYIRFGCLSVRHFLYYVKQLANKDSSAEPLLKDVTGKLLQREFYFTVAKQVPNFDSYDNDISFQLPWEKDRHLFSLWKNGKTGYPWIDAAMRQLHREGWIHLCLRESVASFLTRGDLWISWVWGKDTFEELMLDFEVAVSSGCWMKSSCSAFITGPVEHFCPVTYGKQIDPTGIYVRTYCPELKNFPDEYIYCPWMAPLEVQKAAGCRIGINYPNPIVDHATAGFLCCEKLRSVMDMVHQRPRPSSLNMSTNRLHPHHRCHIHTQQLQLQQCGPAYTPFLGATQAPPCRYHPYSQPRNANLLSYAQADSLLNPVAGQNKTSSKRVDTLCTTANDSRLIPECCTVCNSAGNLMTQLLLHERQDHREGNNGRLQATRRRSLTSPPRRARRRTPPSICSHKLSNFADIT